MSFICAKNEENTLILLKSLLTAEDYAALLHVSARMAVPPDLVARLAIKTFLASAEALIPEDVETGDFVYRYDREEGEWIKTDA